MEQGYKTPPYMTDTPHEGPLPPLLYGLLGYIKSQDMLVAIGINLSNFPPHSTGSASFTKLSSLSARMFALSATVVCGPHWGEGGCDSY
ncbi:hypothetical protein E2C01_042951 [Portunus trituberculatus]|uniref:Uncharacterized protein n=1 Tax=Portunus trituberculatus TaxID=210409 RepID=A0A5B7FUD3_PORTR|nr:hypothetical protein [Portunus trituberculatus]